MFEMGSGIYESFTNTCTGNRMCVVPALHGMVPGHPMAPSPQDITVCTHRDFDLPDTRYVPLATHSTPHIPLQASFAGRNFM